MAKKQRRCRPPVSAAIFWPREVEDFLGISAPTRWRWERAGKLPPRDAHIGGVAIGWHRSTIEFMLAGRTASDACRSP